MMIDKKNGGIEYRISTTDDYEKLVNFFIENRLEFTEEDAEEVPTDLVKCWEIAESGEGGQSKLIGAFVLARREGEFICDGIAVDSDYRDMDLGTELLEVGLQEVKALGGQKIYLVARAPEFFRKHGFETMDREDAPNFFECFTCSQYGVSCHPEVMKKQL